ncbi:hypothetical protein [Natronosalvus rutilus]|uniref:Uncharacterized protein n=1 Tax=Natronosalvus rutilus TaxID=2953753 RepID=A0A9E7SVG5_9EURY|nr:hypothetical protein [Natronosalvus rutilus]UTF54475.1 hypothetical protein NGM29_04130 [Natronosalvus rutilus]
MTWGLADDRTGTTNQHTNVNIEDYNVRGDVLENFDERMWHVTEAVMSVHATLFINGIESCFGLIVEGPSGAGKTTALKPFEGLHSQFYRSDEVTPASFVSHDASRDKDELADDDLIPRIKHKTLLNPEMANWFGGDWGVRKEKMARLVRVMDGTGFTSDSGTHGRRGYQGDYRFNFIGATTPLKQQDWEMMGHTGNRFLFVEMPSRDEEDVYRNIVFGESEYGQKVSEMTQSIQHYLDDLWSDHGGPNSVDWKKTPNENVGEGLMYLSRLVVHARAPMGGECEDPGRITDMMKNIARGHALLYNRRQITIDDLEICGRVALSTVPKKRRDLLRELLQLDLGERLKTRNVIDRLGVAHETATDRMNTLDSLGLAYHDTETVQGGQTNVIELNPEFAWPKGLPFPDS